MFYKKSIFWLLGFIFLLGSSSTYAQKEAERTARITNVQANQFFGSCMDQSYPANSYESKEMFCACSSARLVEQLRQGDLMNLKFPESWQGNLAKEKLLQYVYTPCIKDTLYDLLAEECENNQELEEMDFISKPHYCACQNRRMELVFEQSFGLIAEQNKENLDDALADPITAFMKNDYYLEKSEAVTGLCMKKATITVEKNNRKPISPGVAPLTNLNEGEHSHEEAPPGREVPEEVILAAAERAKEEKERQELIKQNAKAANEAMKAAAEEKTCTPLPYEEAYKPENILK